MFEYRIEYITSGLFITLNKLGHDGWELVQERDKRYIFKRKIMKTKSISKPFKLEQEDGDELVQITVNE